ncbi:MAG TPA: DUF934 domain-containing protein [Polyangiaceae bacterium]|nr:DUF934 domain-containing protein [Polyangiaceae bacterium]
MQIIRKRAIVEDDFVHIEDGAELPSGGKIIVTLARYLVEKDSLLAAFTLGVRIQSDKLPKDIPELHRLALVAIEFPRFTDGRGYSIAKLLRQREKFTGEIRAVGWVLRDNLLFMERCGVDAFEVQPGKPLESAVQAFAELEVPYQATVQDPRPLYRRR